MFSGTYCFIQHVLEFIRIGRIWQEHPYLKPSPIADIPFLQAVKTKLQSILPSCSCLTLNIVAIPLGILALVGSIIGFCCIFSSVEWLLVLSKVFSCLFLVDVVLRIATLGLEHYING